MASTEAAHNSPGAAEELAGYEGAKLGMWLFLATELLLFSVMFAGFAIFHSLYPNEFKLAHASLDWKLGGLNTLVLITSSLTVALALDSVQRGNNKRANMMLLVTIILAGVFLIVKYFEYTGKFHHGIFPGDKVTQAFSGGKGMQIKLPSGSYGPVPESIMVGGASVPIQLIGIKLFFSFYFIMTGVHGLHVIIGASVLAVILWKNTKNRYSHWYYTPVENGALYWHLVDLIWIYLFPLFYLIK